MTKRMPICWKCASKITEDNGDGSLGLVGCKENKDIKNYQDAEKMCPVINPKVVIIISGGCATIDHKPDDVTVEIRDYDVEGMWDEDDVSCKVDDDDDRYQEMIFPAE